MPITEDHQEIRDAVVYEVGYLVLPSVPEENLPKVVSSIVSIIEKAGGTTLDSEDPFLEELAYSMSKVVGARKYVVDDAYIGWMKFEATPDVVEGIKNSVDKIEEVLRTLLIKVPRETSFTFEGARKARAEKEEALNNPVPEVVEAPLEPEVAPAGPVVE
ncbi:MAG: Ribosomal protein [Parcubacteria group bacterium]|nr:Ribosomal protein [Parcubacteria group bacterium]